MIAESGTPASLLELAGSVVRRWRLVLGLPVALAIFAYGSSFFFPRKYRATVSFAPESQTSSRLPASIIGLGAQFGFDFGGDANRSPRFYVDVTTSRRILEQVLETSFADPTSPRDSSTLLNLLDIDDDEGPARKVEEAVRELRKQISIIFNAQTNIIDLTVTERSADLAAAVANRFVPVLDSFNRNTVQSQARERRRFVEGRLQETLQQLRDAEIAYQGWLENNRQFQGSPELTLEHNRLRREIQLREEVHLTLAREYERARIDEFNDLSLITVVTPAVPPTRPSSPRRLVWALVALVSGGMLALGIVVLQEFFRRLRVENARSYEELRSAIRVARAQLPILSRRGTNDKAD